MIVDRVTLWHWCELTYYQRLINYASKCHLGYWGGLGEMIPKIKEQRKGPDCNALSEVTSKLNLTVRNLKKGNYWKESDQKCWK